MGSEDRREWQIAYIHKQIECFPQCYNLTKAFHDQSNTNMFAEIFSSEAAHAERERGIEREGRRRSRREKDREAEKGESKDSFRVKVYGDDEHLGR